MHSPVLRVRSFPNENIIERLPESIRKRQSSEFMLKLKRIYEPYDKKDGYRVLVDRLWPRGVSKEKAHLDLWLKDIAPSTELRKWFNHDIKKWPDFKKRYRAELKGNKEIVLALKQIIKKHPTMTLLYGAKDETHNEAIVLAELLGKLFSV
jgi:uncharacterized protein YeaO (DUF488 family)